MIWGEAVLRDRVRAFLLSRGGAVTITSIYVELELLERLFEELDNLREKVKTK